MDEWMDGSWFGVLRSGLFRDVEGLHYLGEVGCGRRVFRWIRFHMLSALLTASFGCIGIGEDLWGGTLMNSEFEMGRISRWEALSWGQKAPGLSSILCPGGRRGPQRAEAHL